MKQPRFAISHPAVGAILVGMATHSDGAPRGDDPASVHNGIPRSVAGSPSNWSPGTCLPSAIIAYTRVQPEAELLFLARLTA